MRVLRDLLLVVVALVIALTSFTVVPAYFGVGAVGSEITARGTALAERCGFSGPITRSSQPDGPLQIGWWWTCRAEVRFDDGRVQQVETRESQLTGDDLGRPVRVVERMEEKSKYEDRAVVYREDFEPSPVLGYGSVVGAVLLALSVGLVPLQRLVRLVRGKPVDVG